MGAPSTKPRGDNKLKKYLREVRAEMRKVAWPNRQELITYTGVVIFVTFVVALFIFAADTIIAALLRLAS